MPTFAKFNRTDGPAGGIGTIELTVWLVLVAIWLGVWLVSRRPETTRR